MPFVIILFSYFLTTTPSSKQLPPSRIHQSTLGSHECRTIDRLRAMQCISDKHFCSRSIHASIYHIKNRLLNICHTLLSFDCRIHNPCYLVF